VRLIALAALALIATEARAETPGTVAGTSEWIVGNGRMVQVFRASSDPMNCQSVDLSSTLLDTNRIDGLEIISSTYVNRPGNLMTYFYWVVDKAGIHSVFAAGYQIKNCIVSELRRQPLFYSGPSRWNEAETAYNDMVRTALAK
jgi:hypothetical protein